MVNTGVTIIVLVIGAVVEFVAVNEISPEPSACSPVPVLLFVQVYDVVPPVFTVVNENATGEFSQTMVLSGWLTCPFGLTVIVNVSGGPGHTVGPFVNVGVMVIVAEIGDVPGFVAVNDGKFPVPEAISPMLILLFVQA